MDSILITAPDLAYALWQMFAVGGEAQKYTTQVQARYEAKATRTIELTCKARVAREYAEGDPT